MWQRVLAILVTITGLLLAVLGVVSDEDTTVRLIGAAIMLVGIIWLYRQPAPRSKSPDEVPPLRWYQSPILWVPIIGIGLFLISLAI